MSNLIFIFKAYNPNKRESLFMHKRYTNYIANSEYVIRNENTTHGLFGKVDEFPNIQTNDDLTSIINHINKLAEDKIPIYRGLISLNEFDANRLGYNEQEKWKDLLENKLPNIAEKMNIKYADLQYLGAVHFEDGHPHLQFFVWSKERKINYFVNYKEINKLRDEFINDIFIEDLLPIYHDKDLARKNITAENYILNELKKVTDDKRLLDEFMEYEKGFEGSKKIRSMLKDNEIKEIVSLLFDLKEKLKETTGSIKYQYLMKYPDIIQEIDKISNLIINSSLQCQKEIDKYIEAKQKLVEFKYSDKDKIKIEKDRVKQEAEKEIIKLIGNQILNLERRWLNYRDEYSYIRYNNDTRNLLDNILTALYYQSLEQRKCNTKHEFIYNKQLSKQAKKEIAIQKRNSSEWNWNNEV